MVTLTLDGGNSSCKAVVWADREPVESVVLPEVDAECVAPLVERWNPERCALCNVGHIDPRFVETLRAMVADNLLVVTGSTKLPFKVYYSTPETLGADRIAAVAGARAVGKSAALVVDAGTALTLDVVDRTGNFRGGNISPGLSLRLRALHDHTAQLPAVSPSGDLPPFGHDTVTAIRSGVVLGLIDEIRGAYLRAQAVAGAERLLLTGGDANFLSALLSQEISGVEVDELLVARGLVSLLDYNETL